MNKNKLLATLSIVVITGCTAQHAGPVGVLSKYHSMDSSLNLMSDRFYNFNPKYDMNELEKAHDSYLASIKIKDIPNVKKCDVLFNSIAAQIIDLYYFKSAQYQGNPNEKTYADYLEVNKDASTYSIYVNDIVEAAINSKNEDIIKIAIGNQNLKPSKDPVREAELSLIMEEYADKADILDRNKDLYTEEQLSKEGIKLFLEYAPYCQEMAELYDYNSYLDYAYDYSFNREYSVEEATELTSSIRKHVASKYESMDLSDYSEKEKAIISKSVKLCFAVNDLSLGYLLDNYASYMGGSYLDVYKKEFSDGYYLFSNNPDCLGTAFTAALNTIDLPLLFFGNNYQNVTTVIHEFGHCYSLAIYKNTIDKSLDINETCSQSNEVLFASYLKNNYKEKYIKGIGLRNMYSLYDGLLKCSYAVDVENYLFNNCDNLSVDELYDGINEIYDSYGTTDVRKTYWIYPVIASTGYYISYVTSCVASLELYNLALENFNNAKSIYMNLINQKEMFGEVEAWNKAGFVSPFEENTIKEISKFFD